MRASIYLLAMTPAAALAQKPAEPPRPTDWWVSSQQSLIDLQAWAKPCQPCQVASELADDRFQMRNAIV